MNVGTRSLSGQLPASLQSWWSRAVGVVRDHPLLAFRWLVVTCQGATLIITWPLWQYHASPPMLPALPLPAVDTGALLLASLLLVLASPRAGLIAHSLLLVYAMVVDQTRIQPEFVSLAFLLWGTFPAPGARTLARAHLIALWFWAGTNKLLSPTFLTGTGPDLFHALVPGAPPWMQLISGYLLALTEFGIGLLCLFPATRKLAALVAIGFHAGILLTLSPLGQNWNLAVWPWNVAMMFAGLALIAPWREPPLRSLRASRPLVRAAVVVILLAPASWFVGITDAYLSHHLYSSDVPRANTTALKTSATLDAFKVPLPPEHRVFEQYFRSTCKPGDTMTIRDKRWWFKAQGLGTRRLTCPEAPDQQNTAE